DKGRGIAFEDEKKVRIKGSEVGYSLGTIEQTLVKNQREFLRQQPEYKQKRKEISKLVLKKVSVGLEKMPEPIKDRKIGETIDLEVVQSAGRMIKALMEPVKGT